MKILFAVGLYPFTIGGAEMQARIIAEAFERYGHNIIYMCYHFNALSKDLPFDVYQIPKKKKWDILYLSVQTSINKILNNIKPDCIYHQAFVPYSVFICKWAKKHHIPFFFHSADVYTLQRKSNSLKNIVLNFRLKSMLTNSTGIICQNIEQFELIKKHGGQNVKIIYNVLQKSNIHISYNRTKIVWIGKGEPIKQLELFLDLAEKICSNDDRKQFVIFSSRFANNIYGENLKNRIAHLGVTYYEGKDNVFINDFLCKEGKILVNTSISEGISNTYLQAWMYGIPVISLNSNPDHWFDKYEIGKCCNGDFEILCHEVLSLINNTEHVLTEKQCIEFANSHFSEDVIIPQMVEFMMLHSNS